MKQDKVVAVLTSALLLGVQTVLCAQVGPSLNDIANIDCPAEQPFKCLPYGACCRASEFCHSGLCESCFPRDVPESGLLAWCRYTGQHNVSSMRSRACRLACQDRYTSVQLAVIEDPGHTASNLLPSDHGRGNSESQDGKENTATLISTDAVSPAFLRAKEQHNDTNSHGNVILNVSVAEIVLLVIALGAIMLLIYSNRKPIRQKFSSFKEWISGTRDGDQQPLQGISCDGNSTSSSPVTPGTAVGGCCHACPLCCTTNVQSTNNSPLSNGQIASDMPSSNRIIASDMPSINRQIASGMSPSNGQIASDMPSSNRQIASDTPLSNRHIASDMPSSNRHIVSDMPSSNRHIASDMPSSNRQIASDMPSSNRQIASDMPSSNRQIASDTPSSNRHIASDMPSSNRHIASDMPSSNRHIVSDMPSSNRQIASDMLSSNRQIASDMPSINRQIASDTPPINRHIASDMPSSNQQIASDTPSSNRQIASDMPSSNRQTPNNTASSDHQRAKKTTSPDRQAVCPTTSLDRRRDRDTQLSDGQILSDTDNSLNEFKERNLLSAEQTSGDSLNNNRDYLLKVILQRTMKSDTNKAASDPLSLDSQRHADIEINQLTPPSEHRESSQDLASRGPEFRTHSSTTEASRPNSGNVSGDISASDESPRAEATAPAPGRNEPEEINEGTPLLSGEDDINLHPNQQPRKSK